MNPRNVLFIAEGQLGDLLLLTPALQSVKKTFPSASLSVLVVSRRDSHAKGTRTCIRLGEEQDTAWQVLSGNPAVDQILVINRMDLRSLQGLKRVTAELNCVRYLRKKKFDTVVCTFPEDRFALWAFFSGAKVRVGQSGQAFHWLLTRKHDSGQAPKSVLQSYCDLASLIGSRTETQDPLFVVSHASGAWVDEFLQGHGLGGNQTLVAIHPGATGNYKVWPPERYASLIDRLQSKNNMRTILCWSSEDSPIVQEIRRSVYTECVDVNTGDDIGHLGALLKRCTLCISNDSGPRHLSAAVGARSLGLLRQFHDREWKVYPEDDNHSTLQGRQQCAVCPSGFCLDRVHDGEQYGSYCLRMISVNEVVARVDELLSNSRRI
jgi:ADP-heptose:LPS heptosyltransferase